MKGKGARLRSMWISLIVLYGRGGVLSKKEAVKTLSTMLLYTERQARNVLDYLYKEGLIEPISLDLNSLGIRVTKKGEDVVRLLTGMVKTGESPA
ncbi:MAG: hypothetical protein QW794_02210 [Thermosphaera sp.]